MYLLLIMISSALASLEFKMGSEIRPLIQTLERTPSIKVGKVVLPQAARKVTFKTIPGVGINVRNRRETSKFIQAINSMGLTAADAWKSQTKSMHLDNVKLDIPHVDIPHEIKDQFHFDSLLEQIEIKFKKSLKQLANYAEKRASHNAAHQMVEHWPLPQPAKDHAEVFIQNGLSALLNLLCTAQNSKIKLVKDLGNQWERNLAKGNLIFHWALESECRLKGIKIPHA